MFSSVRLGLTLLEETPWCISPQAPLQEGTTNYFHSPFEFSPTGHTLAGGTRAHVGLIHPTYCGSCCRVSWSWLLNIDKASRPPDAPTVPELTSDTALWVSLSVRVQKTSLGRAQMLSGSRRKGEVMLFSGICDGARLMIRKCSERHGRGTWR